MRYWLLTPTRCDEFTGLVARIFLTQQVKRGKMTFGDAYIRSLWVSLFPKRDPIMDSIALIVEMNRFDKL